MRRRVRLRPQLRQGGRPHPAGNSQHPRRHAWSHAVRLEAALARVRPASMTDCTAVLHVCTCSLLSPGSCLRPERVTWSAKKLTCMATGGSSHISSESTLCATERAASMWRPDTLAHQDEAVAGAAVGHRVGLNDGEDISRPETLMRHRSRTASRQLRPTAASRIPTLHPSLRFPRMGPLQCHRRCLVAAYFGPLCSRTLGTFCVTTWYPRGGGGT